MCRGTPKTGSFGVPPETRLDPKTLGFVIFLTRFSKNRGFETPLKHGIAKPSKTLNFFKRFPCFSDLDTFLDPVFKPLFLAIFIKSDQKTLVFGSKRVPEKHPFLIKIGGVRNHYFTGWSKSPYEAWMFGFRGVPPFWTKMTHFEQK